MAYRDKVTGGTQRLSLEEKRKMIELWHKAYFSKEPLPENLDTISGKRLRILFDDYESMVDEYRSRDT